jgi:hypothetical protein
MYEPAEMMRNTRHSKARQLSLRPSCDVADSCLAGPTSSRYFVALHTIIGLKAVLKWSDDVELDAVDDTAHGVGGIPSVVRLSL